MKEPVLCLLDVEEYVFRRNKSSVCRESPLQEKKGSVGTAAGDCPLKRESIYGLKELQTTLSQLQTTQSRFFSALPAPVPLYLLLVELK